MESNNFNSKEVLEIIGSMIQNQQEESKIESERRMRDEEKRKKDLEIQTGMFNSIINMRTELENNVKETKELKEEFNKGLERLDNLEKNISLSEGEYQELLKLCSDRASFLAEKHFYKFKNVYDGDAKFLEKKGQVSRYLKTKANHFLNRSGKFASIRHIDFEKVGDYLKVVDLTPKEILRISKYKSKIISFQSNLKNISM